MNSADFQEGGFRTDEAIQVARWLDEDGVDLLEISGGNYEQMVMVGAGHEVVAPPVAETTRRREAYFLAYAADIKPQVKMPVMVTGGFRTRTAMIEALRTSATDVIGLGRPMCTEPDLPRRLLNGQIERGPIWEQSLRLEDGVLGPDADSTSLRQFEAWGKQGWFCLQLIRMGDGLAPDLEMSVFDGFHGYAQNEASTAERLIRP
jgi:hypothetical protein